MLLVVEQGQGPQDGGQAPPRDQHCRRGRGGSGAGSHHQLCKHGPSVCAGHLLPRAGGQAWAGVWAGSGLGPGELGPRGSRRPGGQACSCPGPVSRGAHPRLPGPWPSVASFSDATPLPPLRRAPQTRSSAPALCQPVRGFPPAQGTASRKPSMMPGPAAFPTCPPRPLLPCWAVCHPSRVQPRPSPAAAVPQKHASTEALAERAPGSRQTLK